MTDSMILKSTPAVGVCGARLSTAAALRPAARQRRAHYTRPTPPGTVHPLPALRAVAKGHTSYHVRAAAPADSDHELATDPGIEGR